MEIERAEAERERTPFRFHMGPPKLFGFGPFPIKTHVMFLSLVSFSSVAAL